MYPLVRELAVDGIPVAVTCRVLKKDDPEFGYRFLADEAREAGESMAERTAWRICSDMGCGGVRLGRSAGATARSPAHRSTTTCVR